MGTLILTACVQVRNTPPTLVGFENTVTINYGDDFDPREGVTVEDQEDKDIELVVSGFDELWLKDSRGGQYTYKLSATDSGGLVVEETIQLIVLGSVVQSVSINNVLNAQTYYIGSNDFDPLRGITATDTADLDDDGEVDDLTDEIVVSELPNLNRPGRYTYQLTVENELGAVVTKTISLTVKPQVMLPETLTSEPITITLWHSNGSTIEASLKTYATDFKKIYPNITVNIVKNGDDYDQLRQNTISAIKGGTLPNIVQGYPDHVAEYITNNAVISVGPYVDHPVWGYNSTDAEERFEGILYRYRNENAQYTSDGEFYSLPFNKSTEVMIYNKDMLDALITSGKTTEMPSTWQDLFAIAADVEAIAPGFIDQYAAKLKLTTSQKQEAKDLFVPYSYDSEDNAFITLLRQWGGQYTSIDGQRKGVALYDSQAARDMLTYFNQNRDKLTIPDNWKADYASDIFVKGQTFMTIGSTGGAYYNTPTFLSDNNTPQDLSDDEYLFEFDVAPLPYNKDMAHLRTAIQQGTNMSLANKGTEQEKLASWLFLKYLTSHDVQLDFTLKTGYQPIRDTVYVTEQYQNFLNGYQADGTTPLYGEGLMKSRSARAAALQADYLFFDQAFVGSSGIREAVGVTFGRVILPTESDTVENALQFALSEARRLLGN